MIPSRRKSIRFSIPGQILECWRKELDAMKNRNSKRKEEFVPKIWASSDVEKDFCAIMEILQDEGSSVHLGSVREVFKLPGSVRLSE